MLKIAKIIDKVTLIKQLIIYNNLLKEVYKIVTFSGFPGGAVVKNPPANAGDTVRSMVRKDPSCRRATKPVLHNY